jgi:hypothetical protein
MTAPAPEPPQGTAALALRLRDLRHGWPGVRITQGMVAEAFGASTALVSSWESPSKPTTPPRNRLRSYASLFATRRSVDGGRLRVLPDDELTSDELAIRDQLFAELQQLRETAAAEGDPAVDVAGDLWRFDDSGPIRLVCGRLPVNHRGDYASPSSYNYGELFNYADVDALVELFGYVRKTNPDSDIRFLLADELRSDDLTAHVALIGGLAWNPAARFYASMAALPVRQVADESVEDGEVFEVERDGRRRRFLPTFLEDDPALGLIEDVALFARLPNPSYPKRTLTVCNGVFSRGVYGAVRILTDDRVREANEAYLTSRFTGASEFGMLLRVPVYGGATSTPDLTSDYHRLFVWPPREEPS